MEADREEDADRLPPGSHLEDALPLPPPTLQPLSTSLGWQNQTEMQPAKQKAGFQCPIIKQCSRVGLKWRSNCRQRTETQILSRLPGKHGIIFRKESELGLRQREWQEPGHELRSGQRWTRDRRGRVSLCHALGSQGSKATTSGLVFEETRETWPNSYTCQVLFFHLSCE